MSDWNPKHTPAVCISSFDDYGDPVWCWDDVDADRDELAARAEAIRKRDEQIAELERLLKAADCPANCDRGAIGTQVDEDEWEFSRCQFCAERSAALKEKTK